MYYNENVNQTIYCPDVLQSPVNQKSFYSNSTQNQINDLEKFYDLLNDRFDKRYKNLNTKTMDLYSCYMRLVALQKKATEELSKHKNKQETLKKRLLNRQYRLERTISHELQPFMTSQENVNKAIFDQFDQHEKSVDQKIQPIINQQVSLKRNVFNRLEQQRTAVFKELQLVINKQETVNRQGAEQLDKQEFVNKQVVEQLDQQKTVSKQVVEQLDQQEAVNKQVVEQLDQQESVNKQVVEQLDEHEMVIVQQLQPFIKNIQDNLANPIANLLNNLSPGTLIEKIIFQGTEIEVRSFLDYNLYTNISTFIQENNKVMSINTSRIDSLTFS